MCFYKVGDETKRIRKENLEKLRTLNDQAVIWETHRVQLGRPSTFDKAKSLIKSRGKDYYSQAFDSNFEAKKP